MAEQELEQATADLELEEDDDEKNEASKNYKVPEKKALSEIAKLDQEDESLRKYKQALLGQAAEGEAVVFDPNNPNKVVVKSMSLVVLGEDKKPKETKTLDLTKITDKEKDTKETLEVEGGIAYKIQINFMVQREIVQGLKYKQTVFKNVIAGIKVKGDKLNLMCGSYGPKNEEHVYTSPEDEMPELTGKYKVESVFEDDDKNKYKEWTWKLDIKKKKSS